MIDPARSFTWDEIEEAILSIPLERFVAALKFGLSDEDGCRIARANMSDDVRRTLSTFSPRPQRTPFDWYVVDVAHRDVHVIPLVNRPFQHIG